MKGPPPAPVFNLSITNPIFIEYLCLQIDHVFRQFQLVALRRRLHHIVALACEAQSAGPEALIILLPRIEAESRALTADVTAAEESIDRASTQLARRQPIYLAAAISWDAHTRYIQNLRHQNANRAASERLLLPRGYEGQYVPAWFARTHLEISELDGTLLDQHLHFYRLKPKGGVERKRRALLTYLGRQDKPS
ncbi:hypothetical protein BOTBODRAFT_37817 [Botryobasidium botryosum FD-172 SS1]|uniref:Uncharacterized protein n=1 Tax=Botryobasidium botryosum (strain FD-172 SS1) TaxID=930990 RepID=A0A067M9H2_BOTB1|nr:hypothetical protein BOTBODRAFT_37817 [Botryobasidium botryosum FD-172 SS1]